LEMNWQGTFHFGANFGGVRVNLVEVERKKSERKFLRASPPPSPDALQKFPQWVKDINERIQQYAHRDAWHQPRAYSETVCMTPYGACMGTYLCRVGTPPDKSASPEDD
jgi:hypothetical protein